MLSHLFLAVLTLHPQMALSKSMEFCGKGEEIKKIRDSFEGILDNLKEEFTNNKGLEKNTVMKLANGYWIFKSSYNTGSKGVWARWCHTYHDDFEIPISPRYIKSSGEALLFQKMDTTGTEILLSKLPKKLYKDFPYEYEGKKILGQDFWKIPFAHSELYNYNQVQKAWINGHHPIVFKYWQATKIPVMLTRDGRVNQNVNCWVRYQDRNNDSLCKFQAKKLIELSEKYQTSKENLP